jgi:hypothetical protein
MSSTRLLSAHKLNPNNPNRVISTTYVKNNPDSIKASQNDGWIIDQIQNPQGIFTNTSGLKSNEQYIKILTNAYTQRVVNYMNELNRKQNLRNLTKEEKLELLHQSKQVITNADPTMLQKIVNNTAKKLGLINNSANNGNNNLRRKTPCSRACSVMGGRRTKTRRTKTRRNRH